MAREIKTNGKKVESTISKTEHKKFKNHCRKLNVSMSQRIRDMIQKDCK